MAKSGMLERLKAEKSALVETSSRIEKQFMLDTLQMTMRREFGWGYDRIKRLTDAWGDVYNDAHLALEGKMESDIAQEHIDRELRAIVGENQAFYSFSERYPEIRQLNYNKMPRV